MTVNDFLMRNWKASNRRGWPYDMRGGRKLNLADCVTVILQLFTKEHHGRCGRGRSKGTGPAQ